MQDLSPTARVILGMLGIGAETGYDIKRITDRSTRFFWGASYGQIYPELRRLREAGLVEAADDPRGGISRTTYRLTAAGREALHDWLTAPRPLEFGMRAEGLLKLFLGDLLEPEEVLANMRAWRQDLEQSLEHFRTEIEPNARALRDEHEFPYHALEYGLDLLEWNIAWCRRMERRLSRRARRPQPQQSGSPAPDPR